MKASHSTNSPLVSVIMPVLDPHPIYFKESIESVLSQTLQKIEVVIVEDPSPRTVKDVIQRLNDPRVRYYANAERTSLVQQKNRALSEARAEFVAMQDADDIAEKDRLEKQFEFLTSHPTIGVLGTQIQVINSEGNAVGYRCYPLDNDSIISAMRLFNPLAHPTVMLRKEVVLARGGYQYGNRSVEDYELWSRLALQGVRFSNHPESLLRYRVHDEASKVTKLHETIRGTLEVKRKYWFASMGLRAKMRMYIEQLLLWVPSRIVLQLFVKTQLSSKLRS